MVKNVMIPLSLLDRIIGLLNDIDLSEYHELRYEYCDILWALKVKKQKLELRDSYAKIISTEDPYVRNATRIEYLQQRSELDDADSDIPF